MSDIEIGWLGHFFKIFNLYCLMLNFDGLQKDNVSNQREHVVHLLANEQSRLRIPEENEPVCPLFLSLNIDGQFCLLLIINNWSCLCLPWLVIWAITFQWDHFM